MNDLLDPPRPTLSRPDSDDLESLMSARGLCISILINTTPGPRLAEPDRQRLHAHARDVLRRLEMEPDAEHAKLMTTRLHNGLDLTTRTPADEALALFVNETTVSLFHLPVGVEDRIVIDPTFATPKDDDK